MKTITCNRCQGKWTAEVQNVNKFNGNRAARVLDFTTCPHCGQTDNHWIYAADVMPQFDGKPFQIKKQQQAWLEAN